MSFSDLGIRSSIKYLVTTTMQSPRLTTSLMDDSKKRESIPTLRLTPQTRLSLMISNPTTSQPFSQTTPFTAKGFSPKSA